MPAELQNIAAISIVMITVITICVRYAMNRRKTSSDLLWWWMRMHEERAATH